jgi:hypothetical protein
VNRRNAYNVWTDSIILLSLFHRWNKLRLVRVPARDPRNMKPLRPSLPYGFICTLSHASSWTHVYPSLNWCIGSCDIKVSRPFPLGRGSSKQSLDSTPLLLPNFHHHAHSVVPPYFETQLHAFKLLTPHAISHLHHRVLKLCFALNGSFHHL